MGSRFTVYPIYHGTTKRGKQVKKEIENHGGIKRIACAAHEYQTLEYLRAIASNMSLWETVSIFCFLCE